MEKLDFKKLLLGTSLLVGFSAFATAPTFAQDAMVDGEDLTVQVVDEAEEEELSGGEIVVTGSRIKRDSFNSISPLQVIDFSDSRDLGLIDAVTILQTTESASGQQIDATFGGFVLDNGPGSETIDLRGLGASRTLVLINDRRIAPSGVEGAPSQPSINLLPSSLIDRTDILLEGASSVYGSDAIAGVVNVILKKDFEGLEVVGTADLAEESGGKDYNVAASWGKNYDRGFIGVGAEYDFRDSIKLADRDYFGGCNGHYEIDENGEIRTLGTDLEILYNEWFDDFQAFPATNCKADRIAGRIFPFGSQFGSIYFDPAATNTGIPNFVDQNLNGVPIDADGDGIQDYDFNQFALNGADPNQDLLPEQKRLSLMAFGEYTMEGDANITPYFEVLYSRVESTNDSGTFQLFPTVGADNPFNPCGVNGSDCGTSNFDFDDAFIQRWNTYQRDRDPNRDGDQRDARICATFAGGLFDNANCTPFIFGRGPRDVIGPVNAQPIVGINGDRTLTEITIENTRLVGGFRGDLPFMNFGEVQDWSFDVSVNHSISNGVSSRPGIRQDRLFFALGNDLQSGAPIAGLAPCTAAPGTIVSADVSAGCVPVNLFAPSLFAGVAGELSSQAERDYLFDTRDFDTEYKQTTWQAFASGTLAEVPAGKVNAVVGLEYRTDQINSVPDDIARDGLFFGFFSDAGATGEKFVREAFAEVDIPLVAAKPGFQQLDVNLSGRILEDEFYGGASTYAAKVGWRPVESLLLKASYGTSFRSPNLRENFLRPQTGFLNLFDPCVVPADALTTDLSNPTGPQTYDPALDGRDPDVLDRCRAEGLDPITLGAGTNGVFSTEVETTGSLDLDPEESTSLTLGFSFEQPFTDAFDLEFGASYYDIDVTNSVVQPSSQFILNDCYVNERDGRSPFCDRIRRDDDDLLDIVNQGFINLNEDEVRGIDFNARFGKEFTAFDRNFDYTASLRANHILEVRSLFINNDGSESEDNDEGQFGFSDWAGSLNHRLRYEDFSFSWGTRYISSAASDEDVRTEFGNAFGIDSDDDGFGDLFSDTCGGPAVGDVNCKDVDFAGDYFVHSAGITYNNEENDWGMTVSVRNVFDRNPPLVDSAAGSVATSGNAILGNGYDFEGRKFFVQLRKGF